jgi:type I restriction enzyme S subunit
LTKRDTNWTRTRLRFVGTLKAGAGFPDSLQGDNSQAIPFFKVKNLAEADANGVLTDSENTVSRETAQALGAFIFPAGSIVFAKIGAALLLSRFRLLGRESCIDNNLMGFGLFTKLANVRFMLHWLSLVDFAGLVNPGAVPSLNADQIADLPLLLPLPSQQRAIADYLDRETARLDVLVAAKERLLALLAEKRRAIIARAITRGLNPQTSLRDSGVPWLGEIPADWKTERAKWLFREREQRSATGEEELLTVSHITGVTPRSEKDVNMFEAETTEGYKICAARDLVINTLWAWMGAMGVARVDGIVSPAYNVYEPGPQLEPGYVDALVRLPVFAQEVTRYSKGVWSSRLRLYPEGFFETVLPVPPVEEQADIVAFIAAETARLDGLSAATERTIALLKERRAALISAAVTGAIDLRNAGSTGTVETPTQ